MIYFLLFSLGLIIGVYISFFLNRRNKENENKMVYYYHVLNKWLDAKLCGLDLYLYFKKNDYKRIGIYGIEEIGWRLYYELKNNNFELFLYDKNAERIYVAEERINDPREGIEDIDVMVVASSYNYNFIRKELAKTLNCPIISINTVIDDMFAGNYPRKVKDKLSKYIILEDK